MRSRRVLSGKLPKQNTNPISAPLPPAQFENGFAPHQKSLRYSYRTPFFQPAPFPRAGFAQKQALYVWTQQPSRGTVDQARCRATGGMKVREYPEICIFL